MVLIDLIFVPRFKEVIDVVDCHQKIEFNFKKKKIINLVWWFGCDRCYFSSTWRGPCSVAWPSVIWFESDARWLYSYPILIPMALTSGAYFRRPSCWVRLLLHPPPPLTIAVASSTETAENSMDFESNDETALSFPINVQAAVVDLEYFQENCELDLARVHPAIQ